jgi:hypothetical protein
VQRDAEALDQLVACVEQRVRCQHALEIGALLRFQQIRRPKEQPGHVPSEQPALWLAARFRRTPACDHPAHGRAFTEVTEPFNFARQLTAIAAAIGPPPQQIGKERFDQPRDMAMAHVFLTGWYRPIQQTAHRLRG